MMTIEGRLDRMERSQRRWRTGTVGLMLVMVTGVTVAQTKPEVQDVVRCKRLEVVNDNGVTTIRVIGGPSNSGGVVTVSQADGKGLFLGAGGIVVANGKEDFLFEVDTENGDGVLKVKSRKGKNLVYVGPSLLGDGMLRVNFKEGKELVHLRGALFRDPPEHGYGEINVFNYDEELVAYIGADANTNGLIRVSKDELPTVTISSNDDGSGNLLVFYKYPNFAVKMTGRTSDDTGGFVSVANKTHKEIIQLYADEYGNGVVGAYNRRGKGRTLQPGS